MKQFIFFVIFVVSCTQDVQMQTNDGSIEYWDGDFPGFITLKEMGITAAEKATIRADNEIITTVKLNDKVEISEKPGTHLIATYYWIDANKNIHDTLASYTVPDTSGWIWLISILVSSP